MIFSRCWDLDAQKKCSIRDCFVSDPKPIISVSCRGTMEMRFLRNGGIGRFGFVLSEISSCVLRRNNEVLDPSGNELKFSFTMRSFVLADKRKMLRRRYRRVGASMNGMPKSSFGLRAGPWQPSTTSKAPQYHKQFRVVP